MTSTSVGRVLVDIGYCCGRRRGQSDDDVVVDCDCWQDDTGVLS